MAAPEHTWIEDLANRVSQQAAERGKGPERPIIVASGISPSGPVHLGNLREIMVAHAVGEELAQRGLAVRHLHFWDDYDRFRRVPATVDAGLAEHLGRPLSAVPDPGGTCHGSYAEHFIAELDGALARLQIRPEQIRQSRAYAAGVYAEDVRVALRAHDVIEEVLARRRTLEASAPELANGERDGLPLRIYCEACGRDSTKARFDLLSESLSYRCEACGYARQLSSKDLVPGKLVWKADWPMRWAHYGVDFEPGGVDHSSPGSSYEVGTELVTRVFGGYAPFYVGYSFVGIEGRSKLSSSLGDVPTPATALRVLEPRILRWQYLRRRPQASFSISFGSEVLRLYDEWDALQARVATGRAKHAEEVFWRMSVATSAGPVEGSATAVPFRILAAAADVTQANREQLLRVVREQSGRDEDLDLLEAQVQPRLSCAIEWALAFQPDDERTQVRTQPASAEEVVCSDEERQAIALLVDGLATHWSLDGLTTLVYGVPKLLDGLELDTRPDAEMKERQRAFFALVYRLLTHADTGPRLPTLLLSLGRERVEALLTPFAAGAR